MRRLIRLIRYVRPYSLHLVSSLLLMALIGVCEAFRILLVGPVFDRVLNPSRGMLPAAHGDIVLFRIPGTSYDVLLQQFVPEHFQNPWTMVAFAMVAATILKGLCEYAGTYLVNYAGF